jgi:prophage regulatory protein
MRVLSIAQLDSLKGISYSRVHIYRLIKKDKFPKPIRLGANRVAFVEREIDAWIEAKVERRDCGADSETARKVSEKASIAATARHSKRRR